MQIIYYIIYIYIISYHIIYRKKKRVGEMGKSVCVCVCVGGGGGGGGGCIELE